MTQGEVNCDRSVPIDDDLAINVTNADIAPWRVVTVVVAAVARGDNVVVVVDDVVAPRHPLPNAGYKDTSHTLARNSNPQEVDCSSRVRLRDDSDDDVVVVDVLMMVADDVDSNEAAVVVEEDTARERVQDTDLGQPMIKWVTSPKHP